MGKYHTRVDNVGAMTSQSPDREISSVALNIGHTVQHHCALPLLPEWLHRARSTLIDRQTMGEVNHFIVCPMDDQHWRCYPRYLFNTDREGEREGLRMGGSRGKGDRGEIQRKGRWYELGRYKLAMIQFGTHMLCTCVHRTADTPS